MAILGVCIPTFVTAPLLVLVFASKLGWLPSAGWNDGALINLVLPVMVLALPQIAIISRLTRAGMIEVLHSNYVRTARAKGLPEHRIVIRHALRAAILPLVSYLGPACAGLITGSLVVEKIFNLPGLGKFFVISALQRDYTVVMGMVIVYAALILVLNLVGRPALCGARSAGAAGMTASILVPGSRKRRRDAWRRGGQGPQPVGRRAPPAAAQPRGGGQHDRAGACWCWRPSSGRYLTPYPTTRSTRTTSGSAPLQPRPPAGHRLAGPRPAGAAADRACGSRWPSAWWRPPSRW